VRVVIEDVVDEIKAALEAHLEGETAALALQPVRDFLIAEEDIPLGRYPAVFILARSTREIAFLNNVHDEIHTLWAIASQQHVDTQVLAQQLFKYKTALRRALAAEIPTSPATFIRQLRVIRHDYAPVMQEEGGGFSKSVQLEIECTERVFTA